jgi:hypothetical protein
MTIRTYICEHMKEGIEISGCNQDVFCRQCKSFLFSQEEIERAEMKLNKEATRETKAKKPQKNGNYIIKGRKNSK